MYTDDIAPQFGDYVAVLRRSAWLVIVVVVFTVAATVALSMSQAPEYRAQADVAVEPFRQAEDATLQEVILGDSTVNTERQVLTSRPVTDRVIDDLELSTSTDNLLDKVTVTIITDTRVLEVRVEDTDPQRAADIANGYVNSYLDHRLEQAVSSLVASQETLNEQRDTLQQQLDDVRQQLENLPDLVTDPETGQTTDPAASLRESLESEQDSLLSRLNPLAAQAAQTGGDAQLLKGGGQVLNPAEAPESPVSPQPVRTGILASVLGLMLGVGLAFLRDHFDDAIRGEDDAKRAGKGLSVLGRVPHMEETQRLVTIVNPQAPHAEAYRALSASVRFLLAAHRRADFGAASATDAGDREGRGQSVLVTSPEPGDGKTSTAANLGVAAARAGMRVVLVDADMRRPMIHRRFGMPSGVGLSDVIAGDVDVLDALVDVGVDNLRVLPAGTLPPNPAELLASPRMRALGGFLCDGADIVVIDGPPVLAVSDTFEMAPNADAVLMVVRAQKSHRRTLNDALERLDSVGATVSGLVVNDLGEKSTAYTYYSQAYEYQPQGDPDRDPLDQQSPKKDAQDAEDAEDARRYNVSFTRGAGMPGTPDSNGSDSRDDDLADAGASLFKDRD